MKYVIFVVFLCVMGFVLFGQDTTAIKKDNRGYVYEPPMLFEINSATAANYFKTNIPQFVDNVSIPDSVSIVKFAANWKIKVKDGKKEKIYEPNQCFIYEANSGYEQIIGFGEDSIAFFRVRKVKVIK